jgi:hypothetical protein
MKKSESENEIVQNVRKIRERLLKEAKGNPSILNKKGKSIAKKYGLKLSSKNPLGLKEPKDAA